jgi:hypothetical protein
MCVPHNCYMINPIITDRPAGVPQRHSTFAATTGTGCLLQQDPPLEGAVLMLRVCLCWLEQRAAAAVLHTTGKACSPSDCLTPSACTVGSACWVRPALAYCCCVLRLRQPCVG